MAVIFAGFCLLVGSGGGFNKNEEEEEEESFILDVFGEFFQQYVPQRAVHQSIRGSYVKVGVKVVSVATSGEDVTDPHVACTFSTPQRDRSEGVRGAMTTTPAPTTTIQKSIVYFRVKCYLPPNKKR